MFLDKILKKEDVIVENDLIETFEDTTEETINNDHIDETIVGSEIEEVSTEEINIEESEGNDKIQEEIQEEVVSSSDDQELFSVTTDMANF